MNTALTTNKIHSLFFLLLICLLSLGQLQKILLSYGGAVYIHDFLIIAWLGYIFFDRQQSIYLWIQKKSPRKILQNVKGSPSLVLGSWLVITTMLSVVNTQDYIPVLYLLRSGTYLLLLGYLAKSKLLSYTKLAEGTLLLGFLWLIFGGLQMLFFPDLRSLRWLGFDDHYYRLTSTFFDPNFAGLSFVLSLVYLWIHASITNTLFKWQTSLLSLLLLVGVAATYSRASFLSLLGIFLFLLIQQSKQKKQLLIYFFFGIVITIGVWMLLPKPGGEGVLLTRTASIVARKNAITLELSKIQPSNLILGRGMYTDSPALQNYQNFAVPNHARVPDNFFILLLVSGGVPAVYLGIRAMLEWYRYLRKQHILAPAALLAVVLHAQFNNSFLEPFLFLFIGLGVVALSATTSVRK
jgi:hypothetical protein